MQSINASQNDTLAPYIVAHYTPANGIIEIRVKDFNPIYKLKTVVAIRRLLNPIFGYTLKDALTTYEWARTNNRVLLWDGDADLEEAEIASEIMGE